MILVDYNVDLEKFCFDLSLDLIFVCASKCRSNIILVDYCVDLA